MLGNASKSYNPYHYNSKHISICQCLISGGFIIFFNKHCSSQNIDSAITLCAKNKKANEINQKELKKIEGKSVTYMSVIEGEIKNTDKPCEDKLVLKEGARVMMLLNDNQNFYYQNGSMGKIVSLNEESIDVKLDGNEEVVTIESYTWKVYKYELVDLIDDYGNKNHKLQKEVLGSFTQIPVKLAYAITIHKSQGQTYEAINLIPYTFGSGQLYVALSRVRSIDGLSLVSTMSEKYLMCSKKVQDFYGVSIELTQKQRERIMSFALELINKSDDELNEESSKIISSISELRNSIFEKE